MEGAVGMVEMALSKLNEHDIVQLDEERKAAMVTINGSIMRQQRCPAYRQQRLTLLRRLL